MCSIKNSFYGFIEKNLKSLFSENAGCLLPSGGARKDLKLRVERVGKGYRGEEGGGLLDQSN